MTLCTEERLEQPSSQAEIDVRELPDNRIVPEPDMIELVAVLVQDCHRPDLIRRNVTELF